MQTIQRRVSPAGEEDDKMSYTVQRLEFGCRENLSWRSFGLSVFLGSARVVFLFEVFGSGFLSQNLNLPKWSLAGTVMMSFAYISAAGGLVGEGLLQGGAKHIVTKQLWRSSAHL